MTRLTCALFSNHDQAAIAVNDLVDSGIERGGLSVLMHESARLDQVTAAATEIPNNTARGAAIGGVAGALLGGLVLGPFGLFAVGPLAAALIAGAGGSFYGALAGLLTGRDVHKPQIEVLEEALKAGKVLVTVDTADDKVAHQTAEILKRHKPLEVYEL